MGQCAQVPKDFYDKITHQKLADKGYGLEELGLVVLFSGNGSNMQNIIESLHDRYYLHDTQKVQLKILACITNNPAAYGIKRCESLGIKCEVLSHKDFSCREDFDRALSGLVEGYCPVLVVLAGFMRVLTPVFTQKHRCINIHPSLLPRHKGAQAIRDSYESAEDFGGVSVHWVNEVLDGGALILQESVPKIAGESFESFENRIHQLEYALYPRAILEALGLREGGV
ncbi:phosphoribosylglycinamide formyltransferase [Helicobacter sp. 12S02634-8]|uniref:phosphoribosylglycinamide formyltransferase n=1 Tax=Helicobacter sp. 12S02634-8 TaxID=1476199 RepID=UPI000BA5C776|nr:phosphoribosylglycinamide formyltransferase [Helicobacter sp. 12S02634-8]PAF47397.1 phosphoribosylglycinamide formyltransferase [Helicobacter sp. 12S02634-8]